MAKYTSQSDALEELKSGTPTVFRSKPIHSGIDKKFPGLIRSATIDDAGKVKIEEDS